MMRLIASVIVLVAVCAWPIELNAWRAGGPLPGAITILVDNMGTPLDNGSAVELSAQ